MTRGFKAGEVHKIGRVPNNQYWSNVTFEVLQDGPSGGYIHVKVLDRADGQLRNGQLHELILSKEGSNLTLLAPAFDSGHALAASYTEAKQDMDEFFAPFIEKAIELASHQKYFKAKEYEGPWDLAWANSEGIGFRNEEHVEDDGYGGHEPFGGEFVTLTKEFMENPDKAIADAKLEKETRERDERKIADINARNKVAKLEKQLKEARKAAGLDNE